MHAVLTGSRGRQLSGCADIVQIDADRLMKAPHSGVGHVGACMCVEHRIMAAGDIAAAERCSSRMRMRMIMI